MSRKKKTKMAKSMYLNPDMDAILADAKKRAETADNRPFWAGSNYGNTSYHGGVTSGTIVGEVKKFHNHYGDEMIFEYDGRRVYGGKVGDVELYGFDLAIDLAGLPQDALSPFVKAAPKKFESLVKLVKMPEILRLNWRDYSWPSIGIEFWEHLWTLLPPMTLICCVGGHGRTGTCAAALMVASKGWTAKDAIKWVKKEYCEDAIETQGQTQYVLDLEASRKD